MFRRKEEGLFDTPLDPNQPADESASIVAPPAASAPSSPSSSAISAPTSSAASSAPAAPSQPARSSAPEARPAAPSASAFRSNAAPLTGDMARNRMPEAKPAAPNSILPGVEKSNKSGRRVLTVGNDILLKGEIATCDRLVIEGKVDATLNDVHTVEIAETGSFKGAAHIEDAEISGLFEGELVVRNRLVIYGTGKVRGKISYGEIEIERGGELTGEIKTTNSAQATSGTVRTAAPARAGVKEAA